MRIANGYAKLGAPDIEGVSEGDRLGIILVEGADEGDELGLTVVVPEQLSEV